MHRFWIFPLICGFAGAFAVPISGWQSQALLELRPLDFLDSEIYGIMWRYSMKASPLGAVLGGAVGLAAAMCDFNRNRRREALRDPLLERLGLNLFWCGIYSSLLIVSSAFLAEFVSLQLAAQSDPNASSTLVLDQAHQAFGYLPYVANIFTFLLATIRTITQNDVLSPRVLWRKWKRSSTLESREV